MLIFTLLLGLAAVAQKKEEVRIADPSSSLPVRVESQPRFISPGEGSKPFEVTRHLIPLREIQGGGPPRDGIPALTRPAFISATEADRKLHGSDVVIALQFGGEAKAYPIRILNWHEVVNDQVGPQPVAVTW